MLRRLGRDQRGQALMMITIMQDLADATAVTRANKLTRESAIASARYAVNTVWACNKNALSLANDEAGASSAQIDSADMHVFADLAKDRCTDTTDDTLARYVQTTTVQRECNRSFR